MASRGKFKSDLFLFNVISPLSCKIWNLGIIFQTVKRHFVIRVDVPFKQLLASKLTKHGRVFFVKPFILLYHIK